MLKNILKISALSLIFVFASCDDDRLDIEPQIEEVYNGYLESEDDMQKATNGLYTSLGSSSNFGATLILYGDLISDNVFQSTSYSGGYYSGITNFGWFADTTFSQYRSLYDLIQRANLVILDTNVAENSNVKSMKGEAKIARGIAYFYLVQLYSSNPTSGLYQEYGIPLKRNKYDPNETNARATVDEVYEQIIKDLTEGSEEMSPFARVKSDGKADKTFLSPTAGKLLLAKAYLTRGKAGDYEKAVQYSDEVLNNSPVESYSLITAENYKKYFNSSDENENEQQPETIFEIEQSSSYSLQVNGHLAAFYANSGGQRSMLVRSWVHGTYDSTDKRKELFSTSGTLVDDPRGVWLLKYPRNVGGNYNGNVKVFRMTEAKYIKMEALAKMGQQSQALTMLNEHVAERGGLPYSGDALTAVLKDKQKEFIGEGHRFFDLKRNNLPIEKVTNCLEGSCTKEATSEYFVFPIGRSELELNHKMVNHPLWL